MLTLFLKEIKSFFNSLTGYIVIIVFLLVNSLFLWVFPGELNVLDSGYANINTLFFIAPWVFLFLIPAITMRMFADEKKSGTIELLLTKPINEIQIILAKYFASLSLVLFSLIPSLIYFFSVYRLGADIGNIDTGGTWGSYIGLFFLAGIYVAIGIFSSSITDNQIVSFIIAIVICFIFYIGFDSISTLNIFQGINSFIANIGINNHYISMSRGVIDSRDMIYFIGVIAVFILFTKTVLQSRKW